MKQKEPVVLLELQRRPLEREGGGFWGVTRFLINALYTLYYETTYLMANIILIRKCIYFGFELIFVPVNVLNRVLWDE